MLQKRTFDPLFPREAKREVLTAASEQTQFVSFRQAQEERFQAKVNNLIATLRGSGDNPRATPVTKELKQMTCKAGMERDSKSKSKGKVFRSIKLTASRSGSPGSNPFLPNLKIAGKRSCLNRTERSIGSLRESMVIQKTEISNPTQIFDFQHEATFATGDRNAMQNEPLRDTRKKRTFEEFLNREISHDAFVTKTTRKENLSAHNMKNHTVKEALQKRNTGTQIEDLDRSLSPGKNSVRSVDSQKDCEITKFLEKMDCSKRDKRKIAQFIKSKIDVFKRDSDAKTLQIAQLSEAKKAAENAAEDQQITVKKLKLELLKYKQKDSKTVDKKVENEDQVAKECKEKHEIERIETPLHILSESELSDKRPKVETQKQSLISSVEPKSYLHEVKILMQATVLLEEEIKMIKSENLASNESHLKEVAELKQQIETLKAEKQVLPLKTETSLRRKGEDDEHLSHSGSELLEQSNCLPFELLEERGHENTSKLLNQIKSLTEENTLLKERIRETQQRDDPPQNSLLAESEIKFGFESSFRAPIKTACFIEMSNANSDARNCQVTKEQSEDDVISKLREENQTIASKLAVSQRTKSDLLREFHRLSAEDYRKSELISNLVGTVEGIAAKSFLLSVECERLSKN